MKILQEDLNKIQCALSAKEKEFYQNGVILITGCAGSIGYELLHYLARVAKVKRIIGIDNCCIGYPNWLKRMVQEGAIEFYQRDISTMNLDEIARPQEVTHIFHMASLASPVAYRENPLLTMDANVMGSRNLLDYYKDKNLKTFCYFSSSEIYGSPDDAQIPTNEKHWGRVSCVGPRACYDESKRYSETLCQVFAQKYGVPCVILRPFNIFGPGMKLNDGRIPTDCIKAIIRNENIPVYSDGTPTRTFCYIADAVAWILKAAAIGRFDVFNIGADSPELTVMEYARLCAAIGEKYFNYNRQVQLTISDDPNFLTDNPRRRCPDLSYSQKELGYRPEISTQEGIHRFLNFLAEYKEQIEEEWTWYLRLSV
ncbi:MAG: NAD-dependent epimerase/dehydratase family protein [Acutalibacteraceae bacterium]